MLPNQSDDIVKAWLVIFSGDSRKSTMYNKLVHGFQREWPTCVFSGCALTADDCPDFYGIRRLALIGEQ